MGGKFCFYAFEEKSFNVMVVSCWDSAALDMMKTGIINGATEKVLL